MIQSAKNTARPRLQPPRGFSRPLFSSSPASSARSRQPTAVTRRQNQPPSQYQKRQPLFAVRSLSPLCSFASRSRPPPLVSRLFRPPLCSFRYRPRPLFPPMFSFARGSSAQNRARSVFSRFRAQLNACYIFRLSISVPRARIEFFYFRHNYISCPLLLLFFSFSFSFCMYA